MATIPDFGENELDVLQQTLRERCGREYDILDCTISLLRAEADHESKRQQVGA
jgi:hypothetical protein